MGARLMAVVAEGKRGRVYLSPTQEDESVALKVRRPSLPELEQECFGTRVLLHQFCTVSIDGTSCSPIDKSSHWQLLQN